LEVPAVKIGRHHNLEVNYSPEPGGCWANFVLLEQIVLEPGTFSIALPSSGNGLVVSGHLPSWAFAALACFFAKTRPWVAVGEPKNNRAVVVFSSTASLPVGSLVPLVSAENIA